METSTSGFSNDLGTYRYIEKTATNSSRTVNLWQRELKLLYCVLWTCFTPLVLKTHWEWYPLKPILLHAFFQCIIYVGGNWCCLCKHSEIQAYWLLMLLFSVKLQRVQSQIKTTTYIWWHRVKSGTYTNDCKSPVGLPKKIKVFEGTAKKCDLTENKVNVASDPKLQNCFFNNIQPVSLDIIKPWSVTCPSTLESLQKLEFEVNNDINVKVSLFQGCITQLNVDVIVNSVNKTPLL